MKATRLKKKETKQEYSRRMEEEKRLKGKQRMLSNLWKQRREKDGKLVDVLRKVGRLQTETEKKETPKRKEESSQVEEQPTEDERDWQEEMTLTKEERDQLEELERRFSQELEQQGLERRQITPPTKNGHAPPPIESRKGSQPVNPYYVWTW